MITINENERSFEYWHNFLEREGFQHRLGTLDRDVYFAYESNIKIIGMTLGVQHEFRGIETDMDNIRYSFMLGSLRQGQFTSKDGNTIKDIIEKILLKGFTVHPYLGSKSPDQDLMTLYIKIGVTIRVNRNCELISKIVGAIKKNYPRTARELKNIGKKSKHKKL